ncbi:MAG: hypothetical protein JSU73_14015 [candidate division WOR-3 bacterium]|nr:MAG: hypothetical protein JSU73_14015 [candidate division WOR-3 bacterium]
MVRNPAALERFELDLLRRSPPDFRQNLAIVEALAEEAGSLGTFHRQDPLEGIETVIRVARAVNSV